jgi:hypothetical protein
MKLRFQETPHGAERKQGGEAGPSPLDLLLFFRNFFVPENRYPNTLIATD